MKRLLAVAVLLSAAAAQRAPAQAGEGVAAIPASGRAGCCPGECRTGQGPEQIKSFDRLTEVLTSGGRVRAVFRYARCRLVMEGDTTDAPDAVGGMELGTFEYFAPQAVGNPRAFVSASQTSLIARRKGHVYNYVKLRLYQDGGAEITARYLQPPKMKVVMDELFLGELNDGQNQGGVYLYQDRPPRDACPCSTK
jgi:hypothetical protein